LTPSASIRSRTRRRSDGGAGSSRLVHRNIDQGNVVLLR
jgi:hypothetical protein